MEERFTQEYRYARAKKRVERIKGLYAHALVTVLIIPVLVVINLKFVPQYHWFWYPSLGISIGLLFHWFGVFGAEKLGFGKDWEEKKIKEFLENEK